MLKPSTLREMQRVQFVDPGWKEMRGLGFKVMRTDDQTYLGHDGDCPGYHSTLILRPTTETAVVLMTTGDRPRADAFAAFDVLDKRDALKIDDPPPAKGVDLSSYAGRFSAQPWHTEVAIVPWGAGLAVLWLPSTDPAGDLEIWKPKGGDLFRRLRADGSEADEVRFERDGAGHVDRFVEFSNRHVRLAETSSGATQNQ